MTRIQATSQSIPRNLDLPAVLADAAFFSLMVGTAETYLPAFALALGAGYVGSGLQVTTGLLVAIPMFAGAILQLVTPLAVRLIGSNRLWVTGCVTAQALTLLLMPLAMFGGDDAIMWLFVGATVYWACGQASGPAWGTWMEEIIPSTIRTPFFARRVRISQFFTMVGFIVGGVLLDVGKSHGWLMTAFGMLFVFAAVARFGSAFLLYSTSEAPTNSAHKNNVGLTELFQHLRGNTGMSTLVFLFAMQIGVQMAGPYFAPFIFSHLKLGYSQFMFLIVLGFFGKVIALKSWGRFAQKYGVRRLLQVGAFAIVPIAGSWISLWWIPYPLAVLTVLQITSGIVWAAYELAFLLMFFEAIPRRERTSMMTVYNLGNSAATVFGALLGAIWLTWYREGYDAYLWLFALSSVGRLLSLPLLRRVSPETVHRPLDRPDAIAA